MISAFPLIPVNGYVPCHHMIYSLTTLRIHPLTSKFFYHYLGTSIHELLNMNNWGSQLMLDESITNSEYLRPVWEGWFTIHSRISFPSFFEIKNLTVLYIAGLFWLLGHASLPNITNRSIGKCFSVTLDKLSMHLLSHLRPHFPLGNPSQPTLHTLFFLSVMKDLIEEWGLQKANKANKQKEKATMVHKNYTKEAKEQNIPLKKIIKRNQPKEKIYPLLS